MNSLHTIMIITSLVPCKSIASTCTACNPVVSYFYHNFHTIISVTLYFSDNNWLCVFCYTIKLYFINSNIKMV